MQALTLFLIAMVLCGTSAPAMAQGYPNKPVKLVVGFAPGGAADYVARAMSEVFGRALGQTVVVENKAGGGSSIAANIVAKSLAWRWCTSLSKEVPQRFNR